MFTSYIAMCTVSIPVQGQAWPNARSTTVNAITLHPARAALDLDGRRLSYLDFGGNGRPLLALHGHLDQGATFAPLAHALAPQRRVIAPDHRRHGASDPASDYTRT